MTANPEPDAYDAPLLHRDVVVIGASAGAIEVLLNLAAHLPKDLPASLFIAQHTLPSWTSPLPELLSARGGLQARHPLHGEQIQRGHIYVAPPDNHLIVRAGLMEVVRGPKENGHRPSADALFRSASAAYGRRVIGVVLSGYQDSGTAGMMSIKACGGLAVAQSPESASVGEMPRSVVARVAVDHVVAASELPALITRLVRERLASAPSRVLDHTVARMEGLEPGTHVELVCPLCTGVLTEAQTSNFHHFRCHVGHTFALSVLARAQNEQMERALWSAVRALEESAALARRLEHGARGELARRFAEKAMTHEKQAELIRASLLRSASISEALPSAAS